MIRSPVLKNAVPLGLLALGVLIPFVISQPYFVHVLTLALIYSILAMGLQLIVGFAGQLSIGHAAFFGAGAYGSAVLSVDLKLPVLAAMLGGAVVAGVLGAAIAPISRLKGNYLAVATLGFLQIVHLVLLNWIPVTRGPLGFLSIPNVELGGFVLDDDFRYYFLTLAVTALVYLGFRRVVSENRFGRSLAALRQNELAATAVGINPAFYKMQVFVLGAASAGLAGGLFAHFVHYLHPNDFTLDVSIVLLMMIVIGGIGSLEGAIIGALLLTFAPEYLRVFKDFRMILYGALLVLLMIFIPGGLIGLIADLVRRAGGPGRGRPRAAELGGPAGGQPRAIA
jgi:branched-chain amino acid transport system permease protein